MIPLSIFITNKSGYPVLSKQHQEYIKYLFSFKIGVIIQDENMALLSEDKTQLTNFEKIKDYYLYLCHLFLNHKEFKNIDYTLQGYLDTFQIPLQPLRDNLPSQTYECFEEDVVKYDLYQTAVELALLNYRDSGTFKKIKTNDINITNFIEQKNYFNQDRIINICVLGGGRGPILRRVILACKKVGLDPNDKNKNIMLSCVEKNRNAFNTLLHLQYNEPELFSQIKLIFSDMRSYKPENKLDIVVSELLGSFGDNELSPECLLNIENYLSEEGIMIPSSYTSYLRPVTCPVVWANVIF